MLGGQRVVVEVKTSCATSCGEAIYHFDAEKQHRVRALANQVAARRVDYVGVELAAEAATVRWLPGIC
jgi:Holliday junction resolvase-like predicted endonuclease